MKETKYKQTEVGLIPSDWEVKTIGEISKLKNGYAFSSDFFSKTGPIVITPGNFKLEGGLKFNDKNTIRYSGYISKEMQFQNGDLLIVMTDLTPDCNLLGKPGVVNSEETILHNQRIGKITVTSNQVNQEYLYWFFVSDLFSKRMKETATGSTVRHTSVGSINNSLIAIPTKAEQTAIATALSDADALISSLEKLIAKKRNIKQGAMQKLLQPKEGWEAKKLGEVCEIFRGGSPRPIESYLTIRPDGINWIKIGDVKKNAKYIESTEEKIISEGLSRSRFVNAGDFLLSNSMSFGRPYIMKISGCIHDGWLVIQNYQYHFDREFLYYVLGSESILTQYKAMASGSSVLNLNKEIVKNVLINCPTFIEEQTRIATILSDMDNEILALEIKLEKYKKVKMGMMQNLLTGKIRLV
jgi:type I restriction enzyme, S subunit